jgi:hypothetical protein
MTRFWDRIEYGGKVFCPVDPFWIPYRTDEKGRIIEDERWINPFETLKAEFKRLDFDDFMKMICEKDLLIARYYDKEKEEVYIFPLIKGGRHPQEILKNDGKVYYTNKSTKRTFSTEVK